MSLMADGVEAASLEPADDLADQAALHGVGLDQHQGALVLMATRAG